MRIDETRRQKKVEINKSNRWLRRAAYPAKCPPSRKTVLYVFVKTSKTLFKQLSSDVHRAIVHWKIPNMHHENRAYFRSSRYITSYLFVTSRVTGGTWRSSRKRLRCRPQEPCSACSSEMFQLTRHHERHSVICHVVVILHEAHFDGNLGAVNTWSSHHSCLLGANSSRDSQIASQTPTFVQPSWFLRTFSH